MPIYRTLHCSDLLLVSKYRNSTSTVGPFISKVLRKGRNLSII
jgi:hypothetical protein